MKKGFTLIELLVYIAIMGFIIVVAGKVFSDATGMRVRSQNMLRSAEQIGNLSAIINEDISQMGAKAWGELEGTGTTAKYTISIDQNVYMNAAASPFDSSSYELHHNTGGENFDSLLFRKMAYGTDGLFLAVREISWAAREDGGVYRRCRTIDACGTGDTECSGTDPVCPVTNSLDETTAVLMGSNVTRFSFIPSSPGMNRFSDEPDTLFGSSTIAPTFKLLERTSGDYIKHATVNNQTGTSSDISNFTKAKLVETGDASSDDGAKNHSQFYLADGTKTDWTDCQELSMESGETYVVEFKMPLVDGNAGDSNSTQFLPGIDHMAVGLRAKDGAIIPTAPDDALLYPPQTAAANEMHRYVEFAPRADINACVALTFAFYSQMASSGKMRFQNFKVFRKSDEAFHFKKEGDDEYDENYAAEETGTATTEDIAKLKKNVKAFELVMEVDINSEKSGTYSENQNGMIILTPNNGNSAIASSGGTPP